MRRAAMALMLALGACDPGVQSKAPLFTAGAEAPQPGLWALLPDGCPPPATAAIPDWPECALPLWVRDGALTMVLVAPSHARLVLSGDRSPIAQVESDGAPPGARRGAAPPGGFTYYAVEADGPAPFRRGRVWELACTEPLPEGVRRAADESGCWAADAAAVRRMAEAARRGPADFSAVWVAP